MLKGEKPESEKEKENLCWGRCYWTAERLYILALLALLHKEEMLFDSKTLNNHIL